MKVAFYTLGCKVNQNETGAMQQLFSENGFPLAQPDEPADVYTATSCTVPSGGDKKKPPVAAPRQTHKPGSRHRADRLFPAGV